MPYTPIYNIDFTSTPDQSPLSDSGNWAQVGSYPQLEVLSGLCIPPASPGYAFSELVGATLPTDQYAKITLGPDVGGWARVYLRASTISSNPAGYEFWIFGNLGYLYVYAGSSQIIALTGLTFNPGDEFIFSCLGTTISVFQNGTLLASVTDSTYASGNAYLYVSNAGSSESLTYFEAGLVTATWSISGNAGVAGATVNLSGADSATTTSDASGNYSFAGLGNGSYTVTPSLQGCVFSPVSQNVTISGSDATGVNFILLSLEEFLKNGVPLPIQIFGRVSSGPLAGQIVAVSASDEAGNLAVSGGSIGEINSVDVLTDVGIAQPAMIFGVLPDADGLIVGVGVDANGNLCATLGSGGGNPDTIVDLPGDTQPTPATIFVRAPSGKLVGAPISSSNALGNSINPLPATAISAGVDITSNGVPRPVILVGRINSGPNTGAIVAVSLTSEGALCLSGEGSSGGVNEVDVYENQEALGIVLFGRNPDTETLQSVPLDSNANLQFN